MSAVVWALLGWSWWLFLLLWLVVQSSRLMSLQAELKWSRAERWKSSSPLKN